MLTDRIAKHLPLIILLTLISAAYLSIARIPAVRDGLVDFNERLIAVIVTYGLVGAFLNSVLANATLIIQIPYTPTFIFLASQTDSTSYLVALVVIGAISSTIGEVISYSIGHSVGTTIVKADRLTAIVHGIASKHPRLATMIILAFAATPLPDDLLIIPLGLAGYGARRIIVPTLIGKGLMFAAIVFFSNALSNSLDADLSIIDPSLFLLVLLILLAVLAWQAYQQVGRSRSGRRRGAGPAKQITTREEES